MSKKTIKVGKYYKPSLGKWVNKDGYSYERDIDDLQFSQRDMGNLKKECKRESESSFSDMVEQANKPSKKKERNYEVWFQYNKSGNWYFSSLFEAKQFANKYYKNKPMIYDIQKDDIIGAYSVDRDSILVKKPHLVKKKYYFKRLRGIDGYGWYYVESKSDIHYMGGLNSKFTSDIDIFKKTMIEYYNINPEIIMLDD